MKVLVTGANGFLGRHVVARLLQRGHAVRALDDFSISEFMPITYTDPDHVDPANPPYTYHRGGMYLYKEPNGGLFHILVISGTGYQSTGAGQPAWIHHMTLTPPLANSLTVDTQNCAVVTTEPITLFGLQTIHGYALDEWEYVLVNAQSDAKENGVYEVHPGVWNRSEWFTPVVRGSAVDICAGTYEGTWWQLDTPVGEDVVYGVRAAGAQRW